MNNLTLLVNTTDGDGYNIGESLENKGIPGVQIAIAETNTNPDFPDKTEDSLVSDAFGTDDKDKKLEHDTIGECASLSKSIAASWLINYCHENGFNIHKTKLSTLIKYGIQENGKNLFGNIAFEKDPTIAQLLSHTSGLGGHYVQGCTPDQEVQSPESILMGEPSTNGSEPQTPLKFIAEPGEEVNYSGTAYIIVELLTRHLDGSGQAYHEIMADWLDKLEMTNSTFDHEAIKNEPMMHSEYLRFPGAAAGMYTTPEDFTKFCLAVINAYNGKESPMPQAVAQTMLKSAGVGGRDFIGFDAGHGFFINKEDDGSITFMHQGANENFRILVVGNTNGKVVYSVANSDNGTPLNCEIVRKIRQEMGFPGAEQYILPGYDVDAEHLAGEYTIENTNLKLVSEGGKLYSEYEDGIKIELIPFGEDGTYFINSRTKMPYIFSENGEITVFNVEGKKHTGSKLDELTAGFRKAFQEPPLDIFDDRQYESDSAKKVNLEIRDQLHFTKDDLERIRDLISKHRYITNDHRAAASHNAEYDFY